MTRAAPPQRSTVVIWFPLPPSMSSANTRRLRPCGPRSPTTIVLFPSPCDPIWLRFPLAIWRRYFSLAMATGGKDSKAARRRVAVDRSNSTSSRPSSLSALTPWWTGMPPCPNPSVHGWAGPNKVPRSSGAPSLVLTTAEHSKPRIRWTADLHEHFVDAFAQFGWPRLIPMSFLSAFFMYDYFA